MATAKQVEAQAKTAAPEHASAKGGNSSAGAYILKKYI